MLRDNLTLAPANKPTAMKVCKYRALDDAGRVIFSRSDSFGSIAAAVRHCCEDAAFVYDDGRRIAAATYVDVLDADGYPHRYKITNPNLRALRWRKV